ncbi:MAG TPA: phosphate signaling complex protein PhoU [Blastocatellia bacterium]|nr:phosphate signaling complex protein PhoU [Blastocatellia bacterium]HMX29835.1 phosphate signaling complex protein PhoU [Blastocatellia bacterium]HMZ21761.1 phosphate signaling complex protein PhoU [Blastocatellia bacterium]HNG34748.1 phosphate signaling complex protein PhoU [Blastocatellia bacterium]
MPNVLETELDQLRERVLFMGDQSEEAIKLATRALIEHDHDLAERVISGDDRIDALELEIEWSCIRILARWSPEARDLRFVMTVNRLIPILERIADHACNLAHATLAIGRKPLLKPGTDLPKMSRMVREMLRTALDAFAASDAAAARTVIERDEEVDRLYDRVFHDLLDRMTHDSAVTAHAARLLLVAKHLERIGDYVTDICEQVVYLKEARVIKHQRLQNRENQ